MLLTEARRAEPEVAHRIENEVVCLNMPLARQLANRYGGRGIPLDDLQQVAYLGLVKAVHRFQPERNRDFPGYAVPTIRGELRKHFRDAGWVVRPPRRIQELQAKAWSVETELAQELGRMPTHEEVGERLGVGVEEVREANAADGCFTPSSLDAPAPGGHSPLNDQQGEEDPAFATAEANVVLAPLVRRLGRRDRRILELRFFRGWTQEQIGEEVGVTQMQVSRLLSRILTDLRCGLEPEHARPRSHAA